jgi:uncharacterized protein (TIGR02246 family)
MKRTGTLLLLALATLTLGPVRAQEGKPPPEHPAHKELRALRQELVEAVNKNDIDALLTHLDKDVVVTWLDGRVSRGHEGVREYIEKMTKGENRKVNSYKTEAEADELTHLYGETGVVTGVVTGHSKDAFVLTDGHDFVVNTRWTATLVKKDGDKWKVAGFHASTGMFDNPVLDIAVRRTALWTGGIAAGAGLVVGLGVAWLLLRRRKQAGT